MKPAALIFACAACALAIEVIPPAVELNGRQARHQLLATDTAGGFNVDATREAKWASSDPKVATVDASGIVLPAGDGEAIITASVRGRTASAKVRVTNTALPWTPRFRTEVIPVLTKQGCNQGACHGALAGKNGFKLTLRGYDPEADYDVLTRQAVGRRVSLADPSASLMLLKPTMAIAHGGGKRLDPNSREYRVIAEWIAAGAPAPKPTDKEVVGLQVLPKKMQLNPGGEHQIVVRAKYSDGTSDDVTPWARYGSNNEGVASVNDSGRVKVTGQGEAAITIWYSSKVLYATVTSPYPNQVPAETYTSWQRNNFIDDYVISKLRNLNIAPSKRSTDAEFIRRAYLDAAAILPTPEEVESFLTDPRPDKRARLVDALLERDEYVDNWAYKWSDLLLVSSRKLGRPAMWSFYYWIRDSVKSNKPWDQFAREIFTGSGSTKQNGALNYFVLHKDTIDLAENVTQAFLGQRLTCARCHNHPLEKWTQKQYYQFANLFSRIGQKNGTEPGETIVYVKSSGDINHPRLLRPLAPAPLDGEAFPIDSDADRRAHFARWLTDPKNDSFARNIVNRVWGTLMGRGLCDPIDDVRATNPASNEELLTAVVRDFVEHRFDIRHLIRTIMNSNAYQLSSEANATNANDNRFYSKYIVRRLPAEVLLDAMSQVTGVPTPFPNYPAGMRAIQLPDVLVKSQFLTVFGRPPRVICDASERSADPSITQALHIINGDTLNRKLSDPQGNIAASLKLGLSDSRILEHLTLAALSRYPTDNERANLARLLAEARVASGPADAQRTSRQQALEDLAWALLSSREFMFNH
ncbi:MAG TPA: DUF1549 domain-containing protein [Bryobacteraceae bacterium]|nr:DUF1549 domain-containing protein [Bryobacteraceae bacterium]